MVPAVCFYEATVGITTDFLADVWIAKRKALPLLHVGLDSQKKSSSLTTCRCIILIAGDSKESLYFGSLEDSYMGDITNLNQ
uniref:Uncharacterized protein n=1 Tax=Solanum tuberosum TaxID=4113 RepID=M1AIM9_SOLTU